ncbi:EG45-like domain containing protein [Rutidosis leptorrhynchoides]|uniref:EG45-like domain containing protein n=1 Tax=Rutidosis leptorrhynchoides TaxID=125765 RepID=UPI003A99BC0F
MFSFNLHHPLLCHSLFLISSMMYRVARCEVGTASMYNPPYTPSACYGNDASQFPSSNLFAAAGEGIWDNGAACGRQYLVRCISAATPQTCISGQTVQVRIIDRAQSSVSRPTRPGTTMVLSDTAFGTIANQISSINIDFQQV